MSTAWSSVDGHFDAEARSRIGELPKGAVVGSFARWTEHNARRGRDAARCGRWPGQRVPVAQRRLLHGRLRRAAAGRLRGLERPIHVVHWNGGTAAHLKSAWSGWAHARPQDSCESFAGTGDGWTNTDLTLALGDSAELGRYVLQEEADGAFHTSRIAARIGKAARLEGFLLNLGGASVARGRRADARRLARLLRLFRRLSAGGRQESSIASVIRHAAPNWRDARGLQRLRRRPGARRVPGQDPCRAGRRRRPTATSSTRRSCWRPRGDGCQARARDLCRRREVQPRRDGRRSRRDRALLSALARHRSRRGALDADRGVRDGRDRSDRRCEAHAPGSPPPWRRLGEQA